MSEDKRLNEVIRVQKRPSTFVMMDKSFLENVSLSWKAKGILAYLLSKPDNWKVIIGNLVNNATDGKTAVYNGLAELKELGYYEKRPIRDEKGVFVRWDSVILEAPDLENHDISGVCPLPGFPEMDNPEMDNPFLGNQPLINNYINNTDFNNNQSSQVMSATPDRPDRTDDIARKITVYEQVIKENINYTDLIITHSHDIRLIDEFIAIIIDMVMSEGRTVRIGGEDKPRALVTSTLLKLTHDDIEHAVGQFKGVTERISKKRQYILTMLYNSKLELNSHYRNEYENEKWQ